MGKTFATILIVSLATCAWATACFDDKNLQALDTLQGQGALLYVWSPRMALSAQHAASAQRQAQRLGLRFVPLHDANVPQAELDAARQRLLSPVLNNMGGAEAVVATLAQSRPARPETVYMDSAIALASSQPVCAASLLERDALRHFPTAFVVQASVVHRYPIIGAMPEAAWAISIAQRLGTVVPVQAGYLAYPLLDPAKDAMADPSAAPSVMVLAPERGVRNEALR